MDSDEGYGCVLFFFGIVFGVVGVEIVHWFATNYQIVALAH